MGTQERFQFEKEKLNENTLNFKIRKKEGGKKKKKKKGKADHWITSALAYRSLMFYFLVLYVLNL